MIDDYNALSVRKSVYKDIFYYIQRYIYIYSVSWDYYHIDLLLYIYTVYIYTVVYIYSI